MINFSDDAMSEYYVPYGAYTTFNSYSPGGEPPVRINYDFSVKTWKYRYLRFSTIHTRAQPNMDISESMHIEVM